MPFLNKYQIDPKLRTSSDKQYKAELRKALASPALTAEQRTSIQNRIAGVGQPRVYDAASLPQPGAIALPASEQVVSVMPVEPVLTRAQLGALRKPELQTMAREQGLLVSGTKADLVDRLLAGNQ